VSPRTLLAILVTILAEHRRLGVQRGGAWRGLDEVPHEAAGFGVA
jgi:hypothetical protein